MTLYELTEKQESGIVVYEDGIMVVNWSNYGDNCLPKMFDVAPVGFPEDNLSVEKEYEIEDVVKELEGSVWKDEETGDFHTNLNILYDANEDIANLFGIKDGEIVEVENTPAKVYILNNGVKVIAPDEWC
jgi:hypothetical protein